MAGKDHYRTERLQIMLDEAELKAIDEWRFDMRMPTRAAAIRELLRRGLNTPAEPVRDPTQVRSTDFGVVREANE